MATTASRKRKSAKKEDGRELGVVKHFLGVLSNMERGPPLMLRPGMEELVEDVRKLVKIYPELEKRASELREEREQQNNAELQGKVARTGSCSGANPHGRPAQLLDWGFVKNVVDNIGFEFRNGLCFCSVWPLL